MSVLTEIKMEKFEEKKTQNEIIAYNYIMSIQ